ncbi:MAG: TlpA family protein disulfide reductase [Ferruginibacter sp.]|nr:TlpA family protein disulfide reductase [Ferruginibacter sp.]
MGAPCIASFPTMQKVVNEYKNDTNVVFLFVDTWEYKEHKKIMENAKTFIKKNKYTFQVLLDDENKMVNKFKVDAIPYKFIINKRGEIVFMGDTTDIALEIENAKR